MGENNFATWPVALYGVNLLGAAMAYHLLTRALISHHGENSVLAKVHGQGWKERLSIFLYAIAIPLAFYYSYISYILYIIVAAMWLIPDRWIECYVNQKELPPSG